MDIWVRLSTYNSAGTLRDFHMDIWWKSGELGNPTVLGLPVLSTWISEADPGFRQAGGDLSSREKRKIAS